MKKNVFIMSILALMVISCSQEPLVTMETNNEASLTRGSESAEFGYFLLLASAEANNGETLEMVTDNVILEPFPLPGANILTINPKSVGGTGTFAHRAANGDPIASGTWEATQLLSFKSYGPSDATPPDWRAGSANIRVHLVVTSGGAAEFDAVLMIRCKLPGVNTPPSWVEGIRINIQDGPNFNKTVAAPFTTLFLFLAPE